MLHCMYYYYKHTFKCSRSFLRCFGICVMCIMKYHSIASYLFDKMDDKKEQSFEDLLKGFNNLKKNYLPSNNTQQMKTDSQTDKIISAVKENIIPNHENQISPRKSQTEIAKKQFSGEKNDSTERNPDRIHLESLPIILNIENGNLIRRVHSNKAKQKFQKNKSIRRMNKNVLLCKPNREKAKKTKKLKVYAVNEHTIENNNFEISGGSIISVENDGILNQSIPFEYEQDFEFQRDENECYEYGNDDIEIDTPSNGNSNLNKNLILENTNDTEVLNLPLLYRNYFKIEKVEDGHIYAKCILCERAGQNKNPLKATKKSSSNLIKHLKVFIEKKL